MATLYVGQYPLNLGEIHTLHSSVKSVLLYPIDGKVQTSLDQINWTTIIGSGSVSGYLKSVSNGIIATLSSTGGNESLRQLTITLNDAQIKSLPTVPVQLIPPPGLGKVIVASIIHGNGENFVLNYYTPAATGYGNIDVSARLRVRRGTTGAWTNYLLLNTMLSTHSSIHIPSFFDSQTGGANADWYDEFENIPVNLSIVNGALGNLTGGHVDNKWIITIGYQIYDLASKSFI